MYDYPWFFEEYYKLILRGLSTPNSPMAKTFEWIDEGVFHHFGEGRKAPKNTSKSGRTMFSSDRCKQIEAMLISGPPLECDAPGPLTVLPNPLEAEIVEHDHFPPSDFEPDPVSSGSLSSSDAEATPFSCASSPAPGPIINETTRAAIVSALDQASSRLVSDNSSSVPARAAAHEASMLIVPPGLSKAGGFSDTLPVVAPASRKVRSSRLQEKPSAAAADAIAQPVKEPRRSARHNAGGSK